MNNYPNFDLYGDLVECEKDLFDLINANFFMIDSLLSLRVKGFVNTLPSSVVAGDMYIKEDSIFLYDGKKWKQIPLKDGMSFYDLGTSDFYFYEGGQFVNLATKFSFINGPANSTNETIPVFDGVDGSKLQGSDVYITAQGGIRNNVSGVGELVAEEAWLTRQVVEEVTSNISGSNASLFAQASRVVLENASLASISKLTNTKPGLVLTLHNKTGNEVTVKHNNVPDGILLPEGEDIVLPNNGSARFVYSQEFGRSVLEGGAGGGGGGGTGKPQGSLSAPIAIDTETQITPKPGVGTQAVFVKSVGGAITQNGITPFVTTKMVPGQKVVLVGTSDTDVITYINRPSMILNGSAELTEFRALELMYLGSNGSYDIMLEVGRNF